VSLEGHGSVMNGSANENDASTSTERRGFYWRPVQYISYHNVVDTSNTYKTSSRLYVYSRTRPGTEGWLSVCYRNPRRQCPSPT
jgi:hypothetical protein